MDILREPVFTHVEDARARGSHTRMRDPPPHSRGFIHEAGFKLAMVIKLASRTRQFKLQ